MGPKFTVHRNRPRSSSRMVYFDKFFPRLNYISHLTNLRSSSKSRTFDLAKMEACFRVLEQEHVSGEMPLPKAASFLAAISEMVLLFDILTSALNFVRRDMQSKIDIIAGYCGIDDVQRPSEPVSIPELTVLVRDEIQNGKLVTKRGESPSASRTILRLLWALQFFNVFLDGLNQIMDPTSRLKEGERTIKWAVARSYSMTLSAHHSWVMRSAVNSACILLPSKEEFFLRIGVSARQRAILLQRLTDYMPSIVGRMHVFYKENAMLDLP